MSEQDYAGDLSPTETWTLLENEPEAQMVDVRTDAEFAYIGGPDLASIDRGVHRISWKVFPDMARNPHFEDAVKEAIPDPDTPIVFLCRSGQRSLSAAKAMTALGYARCYNVAEGFEGDKDENRHRGTVNGWKVRGLPWIQT